MSKTQQIANALGAELDRRRGEIDGDPDLRSVTFVVKLKERSGIPRTVIFARESEHLCST